MDKKNIIHNIIGYGVFIAILGAVVIARFVCGAMIHVDGMSMSPTFKDGGYVCATIVKDDDTINAGDIVIFKHEGVYLIKRVHATPGEATQPDEVKSIPSLTMKDNEYYVLGDNWENSNDSRYFGAISREDIEFKFNGLYWTRPQVFIGVFIPVILLIAALTIALIPASRTKRSKKPTNVEDVDNASNE